ncbi:OTU domain-containing protein 2 [Pseudozyma hubeiensis]|nr:OTU domain-containing protein 2 [Pseudozyma hubeiensis]
MPKKGKKASRPAPQHNDSLRKDIEANRDAATEPGVIDPFVDDDGFDIADELLAALDARDAQEAATTSSSSTQKPAPAAIPLVKSDSTHSGGLRGAGERLINGLRHHHPNEAEPANPDANNPDASAVSTSPNTGRRSSIRKLFSSSPKTPDSAASPPPDSAAAASKKKPSRQQQRKDRKAAEAAEVRRQAEEEVKLGSNKPDEAALERQGITAMCSALGVKMHEITPDGHCLYAAVADQLNLRRPHNAPTDYKSARTAAAREMRTHPDTYKPFISDSDEHMAGIINKEAGTLDSDQAQERYFLDYCDAVEKTGVWGGQPEILALSRAFGAQINVVMAGRPVLKVGEGEYEEDGKALLISYHRKMYGLGEHYNSLRPADGA